MEEQNELLLNETQLKDKIYVIRGVQVMLDSDLAEIYGYTTKRLNEQVKNNIEKFDEEDLMFQLTKEEKDVILRSIFDLKFRREKSKVEIFDLRTRKVFEIPSLRLHRTRRLHAHDRLKRRTCHKTKQSSCPPV